MEDYKPNSHRSKMDNGDEKKTENKKDIKPIASGKVKKKSSLAKMANNFVNEDVKNVKSYILMDVLIPAAKKAITDIVSNGIEMLLYGETRRRRESSTGAHYVSYNRYSERDRRSDRYDRQPSRRYGYSHEDVLLATRDDADAVLSRMDELISEYGEVSVADMYDLVGITGQYTDNKYGWTNIRDARPVRVSDGYIIEMPKAIPLD